MASAPASEPKEKKQRSQAWHDKKKKRTRADGTPYHFITKQQKDQERARRLAFELSSKERETAVLKRDVSDLNFLRCKEFGKLVTAKKKHARLEEKVEEESHLRAHAEMRLAKERHLRLAGKRAHDSIIKVKYILRIHTNVETSFILKGLPPGRRLPRALRRLDVTAANVLGQRVPLARKWRLPASRRRGGSAPAQQRALQAR